MSDIVKKENYLKGYERLINGQYGIEIGRDENGKLKVYKFKQKG